MPSTRFLTAAVIASLTLASAAAARAGDVRCAHCGVCGAGDKVCRLVCEEKKVDVVCWGCLCEDFCLPGPSEPGCQHSTTVCDECDKPRVPGAPQVDPKRFVWREWFPGCARIFTRKKLYKKVETVTVPSYRWVVEELCPHCQTCCEVAAVDASAEASLPTPPVADARLIFTRK